MNPIPPNAFLEAIHVTLDAHVDRVRGNIASLRIAIPSPGNLPRTAINIALGAAGGPEAVNVAERLRALADLIAPAPESTESIRNWSGSLRGCSCPRLANGLLDIAAQPDCPEHGWLHKEH